MLPTTVTTTIYYTSLIATTILRAGYHYLYYRPSTEEVGAEKVKGFPEHSVL